MKKYYRYLLAFVLTVVLLAIARQLSTRHRTEYSHRVGGVVAMHRTVTEDFGVGPVLRVTVPELEGLTAVALYRDAPGGPYSADTLDRTEDGFASRLPARSKGEELFYHIELSENGEPVAQFPPHGDQFIKFKGHVPEAILIPHIFFMFATIYLGLMTVFTSIDAAKGRGELRRSVRYLLWTFIASFIGGIPLGYMVSVAAFGQGWSGIPIGWDITDNKTVLLLLLWLITLILAWRGLRGGPMAISKNTYMILAVVSFVVTFAAFIIPHSI